MIQVSAGSLQHNKPVMPWRSQSNEDWLHQEVEKNSEQAPETRFQTEGFPAERMKYRGLGGIQFTVSAPVHHT